MASGKSPPGPWDSSLKDLDAAMSGSVRLDCIGGFVVTQLYGLDRATVDVDVIELAPGYDDKLTEFAASRRGIRVPGQGISLTPAEQAAYSGVAERPLGFNGKSDTFFSAR